MANEPKCEDADNFPKPGVARLDRTRSVRISRFTPGDVIDLRAASSEKKGTGCGISAGGWPKGTSSLARPSAAISSARTTPCHLGVNCSAVLPSTSIRRGSAPDARSASMTSAYPNSAAQCNGVLPSVRRSSPTTCCGDRGARNRHRTFQTDTPRLPTCQFGLPLEEVSGPRDSGRGSVAQCAARLCSEGASNALPEPPTTAALLVGCRGRLRPRCSSSPPYPRHTTRRAALRKQSASPP
eukprot:scaffold90725_cov33-Tisochrysis_lutea.AAC.1